MKPTGASSPSSAVSATLLKVDGAEDGAECVVVGKWLGADGKLGQGDFFGGSVFWG